MKRGYLVFGSFILLMLLTNIYAGEVKITTYYPAPYGRYDIVHTNKLGVGSSLTSTDLNNLEDGEMRVTGCNNSPWGGWGRAINLPKDKIILWGGDTMIGVEGGSGADTLYIKGPTGDYMWINTNIARIESQELKAQKLFFCDW